MIEALYDHLVEKSGLYFDKMATSLWDGFGTYDNLQHPKRAHF